MMVSLKKKKHWIFLGGGLTFLFLFYLLPASPQVKLVLRSKRDLKTGQLLQFWDYEWVAQSEEGGISDQQFHFAKGASLAKNIPKGKVIQWEDLRLMPGVGGLGSSIPNGYRAYSFRPSSSPALNFSDRIDLFWQKGPGKGAYPLKENLMVLQASPDGTDTLIVAVQPQDIPLLEQGRVSGELIVVLRSSHEVKASTSVRKRNFEVAKPRILEIQ